MIWNRTNSTVAVVVLLLAVISLMAVDRLDPEEAPHRRDPAARGVEDVVRPVVPRARSVVPVVDAPDDGEGRGTVRCRIAGLPPGAPVSVTVRCDGKSLVDDTGVAPELSIPYPRGVADAGVFDVIFAAERCDAVRHVLSERDTDLGTVRLEAVFGYHGRLSTREGRPVVGARVVMRRQDGSAHGSAIGGAESGVTGAFSIPWSAALASGDPVHTDRCDGLVLDIAAGGAADVVVRASEEGFVGCHEVDLTGVEPLRVRFFETESVPAAGRPVSLFAVNPSVIAAKGPGAIWSGVTGDDGAVRPVWPESVTRAWLQVGLAHGPARIVVLGRATLGAATGGVLDIRLDRVRHDLGTRVVAVADGAPLPGAVVAIAAAVPAGDRVLLLASTDESGCASWVVVDTDDLGQGAFRWLSWSARAIDPAGRPLQDRRLLRGLGDEVGVRLQPLVIELGERVLHPEEFEFWVRSAGSSPPRSIDACFEGSLFDGEAHWTAGDETLPIAAAGGAFTWRIPLAISPDERPALEGTPFVLLLAIESNDGATSVQRVPASALLAAADVTRPVELEVPAGVAPGRVFRILGEDGSACGSAVVSVAGWEESGTREVIRRTVPTNESGEALFPALPDDLRFEVVAVDLATGRAGCLPGKPARLGRSEAVLELHLAPRAEFSAACRLRDGSTPESVTGWLLPRSPALRALRCRYEQGVLRTDAAALPGYRLVATAPGSGGSSAPNETRRVASDVSGETIVLTAAGPR